MPRARTAPPAEKTAEQLRTEIEHLNRAIAALERYAELTGMVVPRKKKPAAAKAVARSAGQR